MSYGSEGIKYGLRAMLASDIIQVVILMQRLSKYDPGGVNEHWAQEYLRQHNECVVATDRHGQVLGFGSVMYYMKPRGGLQAYLEDIVVAETSQNQGIGSSIVSYLVNKARIAGAYRIVLTCSIENLAFYRKQGFESCEVAMKMVLDE